MLKFFRRDGVDVGRVKVYERSFLCTILSSPCINGGFENRGAVTSVGV